MAFYCTCQSYYNKKWWTKSNLQVSTLVLDEADTLTDDSFVERIEILLKRMAQAQIILVSATLPRTLPDVLQPYGEAMQHVITITL